jgi:hypothetical protein
MAPCDPKYCILKILDTNLLKLPHGSSFWTFLACYDDGISTTTFVVAISLADMSSFYMLAQVLLDTDFFEALL